MQKKKSMKSYCFWWIWWTRGAESDFFVLATFCWAPKQNFTKTKNPNSAPLIHQIHQKKHDFIDSMPSFQYCLLFYHDGALLYITSDIWMCYSTGKETRRVLERKELNTIKEFLNYYKCSTYIVQICSIFLRKTLVLILYNLNQFVNKIITWAQISGGVWCGVVYVTNG